MAKERLAALGLTVRTGRAVVVAVGGPVEAPEILAKTRIDVATTFDEGAVYHVGQEMQVERARAFLRDAEVRFVERASAELRALTTRLEARVVAAAMVAPPARSLPALERILKSHPLVHAAEGELYRRVFAEAGAALGVRPVRVSSDQLAATAADALGLTPAGLAARLATIGKASGRPWAADQKQAALGAWLALANA